MRDLSKLEELTKKNTEPAKDSTPPPSNKKKKLLIVAVVCLLAIAVGSKIINKHLKKKKQEEVKAQAELNIAQKDSDNKTEDTTTTTDSQNSEDLNLEQKNEASDNDKMTFTFYNNLQNESVEVDAVPTSQRAQYKYTYVFQVASFRNMNETKYYTQKMESVGLKPQFTQVGNWIRMTIGPYDSKRAMAPDIIKLQKIGINSGFAREVSKVKIEPPTEDKTKSDGKTTTDN